MTRRSLLGLLAAVLALPAARAASPEEGFRLMPMDEVERLLGQPDVSIYDVNIPELWAKHRLPGAIHAAGRDLGPLLPPDRARRVIFYCSNPK